MEHNVNQYQQNQYNQQPKRKNSHNTIYLIFSFTIVISAAIFIVSALIVDSDELLGYMGAEVDYKETKDIVLNTSETVKIYDADMKAIADSLYYRVSNCSTEAADLFLQGLMSSDDYDNFNKRISALEYNIMNCISEQISAEIYEQDIIDAEEYIKSYKMDADSILKVDYLGESYFTGNYYKDYCNKSIEMQGRLIKHDDEIYRIEPMYSPMDAKNVYVRTSDIKSIDNESYLDSIYNLGVQYGKTEGMLVRPVNFTRYCKIKGMLKETELDGKKVVALTNAEIYFDNIEYDYEISVDELYNELNTAILGIENNTYEEIADSNLSKYNYKWIRIHGDIKEYMPGDVYYRRGDKYRISDYVEGDIYGYTDYFYIELQDEAIGKKAFKEGESIDLIGFCTLYEPCFGDNTIKIDFTSGLGY